MTVDIEEKLMSEEEFLDLPDDCVERWLINGLLREDETGMTYRNIKHAQLTALIAHKLLSWLDEQPEPRGIVGNGEVGFWLPTKQTTLVGVDVA